MKQLKQLLALLLCLALVLSLLPAALAAQPIAPAGAAIGRLQDDSAVVSPAEPASVIASGSCGDNLTWTLTDAGVLSIAGTGAMNNYGTGADARAPWYDNRDAITSVSIGDGVTSIGTYAFYDCAAVTDFSVAGDNPCFRSVDGVLYDHACTVLYAYPGGREANFFTAPVSVRVVESYAFSDAVNLQGVTLPAVTELRENAFHNSGVRKVYCPKLQNIGAGAFAGCQTLAEFTFGPQVESIGMAAFLGCTGVEKLTFMGSAPTVGRRAFPTTLSADAYYPADDDTWTEEVSQSCGAPLNWIGYAGLPDGYYLIGPAGWTDEAVDLSNCFVLNYAQGNNDSSVDEYMLTTTLTAGDPIKVVKVFNGTINGWYPNGTGNEYTVDAAHSGDVTIYFRPRYNSAWSAFGGYIWIEAAPETKYGLRVNGEEVTSSHLTDFATNPSWSFDGDHTLTILKDIKGDCDYLDDVGFLGPNVIENYGLEGLVIDFAQHARLTASDKASSTWPSAIYAMKDTVITGAGGGECVSVWEDAIGVRYGATLTIRDTDLQVRNEDYDGILGGNLGAAKSRLVVDHARLDVTANTGYSAISGFGGGIELIDCEIVEPAGGRISDDGASIVNADGSKAAHVVIEPIAVKYGLRIDGVEVTEDNKDDVLGNGIFSFDGDHTLTIHGDYSSNESQPIIDNYGLDGLEIHTETAATLWAEEAKPVIRLAKDTTFTGESLTVVGEETRGEVISADSTATVTVRNTKLTAYCAYGYAEELLNTDPVLCGGHWVIDNSCFSVSCFSTYRLMDVDGITLQNCYITTPEGGRISDDGSSIVNADGSKAAHVVIEPIAVKYGLRIDGVEVTEDNKDDVLGNGIFSFDGEQTLTVTGDYSSSVPADQLLPVIENYGLDGLTVDLQGKLTGYLTLDRDTTLCGTGSLVLPADRGAEFGIRCRSLTVIDVALDLHVSGTALWGWFNDSALVLDNVTATLESGSANGRPIPAVSVFPGGITLKRCSVVEPVGAKVDEACSGEIRSADGDPVSLVKIGRWENPFVDVEEGRYYYEPVLWAFYHDPQVTNGTDATHFSPNKTCTRAQVVTFLWRAMGCPEPTVTTHNFTDVNATAYYYKAMLWAVENNVTTGTGATTFGPNKEATRAQVVTFIWRTLGSPEPETTDCPFTDLKPAASYYKAVLWAVENGVTNGTSATTFSPNKTCTRGQVVTFLYNAFAE